MTVEITTEATTRRWFSSIGAIIAIVLLALLFWRFDWVQFALVLRSARPEFVIAIFFAIVLGQLLRAWKWQQILIGLRHVSAWRLFEAAMAGYLANLMVPLGLSPFVRSWIVARQSGLAMSSVLATVAVDRLVDGLVFAALVLAIIAGDVIPEPESQIRMGLAISAVMSAVLVAIALTVMWRHKHRAPSGAGFVHRVANWLPQRLGGWLRIGAASFGEGTVWPRENWRRGLIVVLSLLSKLVAASHLFLAGLAFQVDLAPVVYLVLLAILGFIVVLAHLARIPAGFILGGIFALGLFGIGKETALAMVTLVMASNITAIIVFGGSGLWRQGLTLRDLSAQLIRTDGAD